MALADKLGTIWRGSVKEWFGQFWSFEFSGYSVGDKLMQGLWLVEIVTDYLIPINWNSIGLSLRKMAFIYVFSNRWIYLIIWLNWINFATRKRKIALSIELEMITQIDVSVMEPSKPLKNV